MAASSLFIDLAEAVKNLLNANTFSQEFKAERIVDPLRPLETLETLRVDVILGDRKQEPLDRSRMANHPRIEIVVRQVIKPIAGSDEETAALDALVAFVEELDACVSKRTNRRPADAPWAAWLGSELVYPFLPKHLREAKQFTSILRLTYYVATTEAA